MSSEEMVQESGKELHFFDRLWPKRTLALILGLSMLAALITPAAFRKKDAQSDETETAEPVSAETQLTEPRDAEPRDDGQQALETIEWNEAFLAAYDLCTQAIERGDYEAALMHAEECLAASVSREETATALAQRGDVLFALERYDEAKESYRRLADMDVSDLVSLYALNSKLARCQLLGGELEDALLSCNLALEQANDDAERAEMYAVRGVVLFYREAFAEAKADFEAALECGYEDGELLNAQIEQCEQQMEARAGGEASFAPPAAQSTTGKTETPAPESAPEPTESEKNAAIYYFGGQYEKAAAEFRSLLGKSYYYTDMQLYSNIAKCEYLLGDYAGAVESCTVGLRQKGSEERAALYTLRGSAYMALGESALAAPDFEAAVANGASDPQLNTLQAAICYYFSDNYDKCIELGTPLINVPGYEEAALWVAYASYMTGDLTTAAELLERSTALEQSYTREDELYRLKARCEFLLGRYAEAVASAGSGLAANSALTEEDREIASELYYLRGAANLSVGQYDAARADLGTAWELGAENTYEVLSQLTLSEFLLGDYENAARHGELAVETGEATSDLYYWTGLSEFSSARFEQARAMLQACRELEPTKENIWFYIGVCSFSMEQYETAIEQFSASIEALEPAADRSRYNRAICYLQREAYQKAKEDLQIAAESASADVAADAEDLLGSLRSVLG